MDRRSFLKIAGVSSIAYAMAPGEVIQARDQSRLSTIQRLLFGLTAAFLSTSLTRVTPHYNIPDDWWEIVNDRSAYLKGGIMCDCFPATCILGGIGLFKGEILIVHQDVAWTDPQAVMGGTVSVPILRIDFKKGMA